MMKFRYVVVVLLLALTLAPLSAQRKNKAYLDYIEQYKSIAIKHQKLYGIPASITLAQGLLESGAGRSELARKSNNHFGIKCHSDWKGKRVYHDDDRKDDCFRKYDSPEDSFEDHAKFLKRARYASLFELKVTDYRGWAKGLKACGYATDRSYANKLIQTIELYELYEYDRPKFKPIRAQDLPPVVVENPHAVYRSWGLLYVEARDGDETLSGVLVSVTCAMVHRSMRSGAYAGLSSLSQGAGGYTASVGVYNPGGDLFLTDNERRALGLEGGRVGMSDPWGGEAR